MSILVGCHAARRRVVAVRIVNVLAFVLLTLTACGLGLDVEQENRELNDKLVEFIRNGPEETRPFIEFTSWEWDTVKVVNLETLEDADVEAMTGEDIDVPTGQNGLFVYYKDGKRVRTELVGVHEFCSGSYTRDAVVHRGYSCWLQDQYRTELPRK